MRYLAKILNEYNCFLRLHTQIGIDSKNEPFVLKAEHFLYNASCVLKSLQRMFAAEASTVMLVRNYLKQLTFNDEKKFVVSAEPLFEVYSQIPGSLGQLVVMQNQLLTLLQSILGIKNSVPSSLNKAITNGLSKYGFSTEICDLISNYWKNGGKYIRDVRDINEHYASLVDNSFFCYEKDPGTIEVYFPDNPESKSPESFTYTSKIDAYEAIAKGIRDLSDLLDKILETKGVPPSNHTNSLLMAPMGDLTEEQERTLGLMIDVTKVESKNGKMQLSLETIEMKQIIPDNGKGNVTVGKLVPDNELDDDNSA